MYFIADPLPAVPRWNGFASISTGLKKTVNTQFGYYVWSADADIPELTTLAQTVETWSPAVPVVLTTKITNASTEGMNRLVEQAKRQLPGPKITGEPQVTA